MFEVLKKYGFSEKFIKWVQILHTNMESSVTNNGYTTGYFQIERGTRQGDPLAPYLFIIVIEVLVIMVKQNYKIKGIIINKTEFKQCLFADDATFFIHDLVSLNELKNTISTFSNYSSLEVNYEKSEIAFIGSKKGNINCQEGYKWIDLCSTSI